MKRRAFVQIILPAAVAGTLLAQKKQSGRLSGVVKSVDKAKMTIEMSPSNSPNSSRKIIWDANTKFTLDGKPAQADVGKETMRVVAVGEFEGVDLKATKISYKNR